MIPFKNYLKTDLYKFVKSNIVISHFLIPIVGVIIMLEYFTLSSWSQTEKVSAYIQVISMAFPLIISILINMVYEQEEEATFIYFLLTPTKRYIPHISKLLLLLLFGLIATMISILGFGTLFTTIDAEILNIMFYLKLAMIIFISIIPLYMLHYFVVFNFGKGSSISMGVVGSLVTALMITGIGEGLWFILPWGVSIRLPSYFFQYKITNNLNWILQNEVKLGIMSLVAMIIIGIAIIIIFSNYWEGRKEYS
ncbi:MAG: lantibiotic immunity ABC transporter MutG family permease subunit [Romboutsia sp.]